MSPAVLQQLQARKAELERRDGDELARRAYTMATGVAAPTKSWSRPTPADTFRGVDLGG